MAEMTRMQKRVYDYVERSIRENGYAPSVREIGEALGLRSPSTVHFHLRHLAEMGLIERSAGKVRAISVTKGTVAAAREEREAMRVPVLGHVAAGRPILAQECIEDYLIFDTGGQQDEYFALRVRGESMVGLGILSGDLVVVHQQRTAHNGEIVVALFDNEATVKTFRRRNGEVWLLPANPEYRPIDGRECELMGRVVAVVRQY